MKNYNLGTYVLGLAALAVSVYVASMAWSAGQKDEEIVG
jgi:hypothetical protein